MATASLFRIAAIATGRTPVLRTAGPRTAPIIAARAPTGRVAVAAGFHASTARRSEHPEETYEEFTDRFEKEFDSVQDVFELQRNLNNCFAYDLVPSPVVIAAALKAARRVNDFPTAVRIFEAVKNKVENRSQYDEYLVELKALREQYGIPLKEDMYPDDSKNWKSMS